MAAVVILWILLTVVAVVVLGALRRAAYVLERVESQLGVAASSSVVGAPIGTGIADHELREQSGSVVRFTELLGMPAVYLFMNASCRPCHDLVSELDHVRDVVDGTQLRLVVNGGVDDARQLQLPAWAHVLVDADGAATRAFHNPATPQAFALDERGIVVDSLAPSSAQSFKRLISALKGGDPAVNHNGAAALRTQRA